ncbi:MAG: lysophospholipid acyltransferase family protein [Planctomycetota bacterium]
MRGSLYLLLKPLLAAIFRVAVRSCVLGAEHTRRQGAYLLVVAHLSHNDPIPVSAVSVREVDWMARQEAFDTRLGARFMRLMGSFAIVRTGEGLFARPGLREALGRLDEGRVVGVFPEAEVMSGERSVLNGGPYRLGAFWLARRARVPIVPCVVLGSGCFSRPTSWLPLKQARVWVAYGPPIEPNLDVELSREGRQQLGQCVAASLRSLHAELATTFELPAETRLV